MGSGLKSGPPKYIQVPWERMWTNKHLVTPHTITTRVLLLFVFMYFGRKVGGTRASNAPRFPSNSTSISDSKNDHHIRKFLLQDQITRRRLLVVGRDRLNFDVNIFRSHQSTSKGTISCMGETNLVFHYPPIDHGWHLITCVYADTDLIQFSGLID